MVGVLRHRSGENEAVKRTLRELERLLTRRSPSRRRGPGPSTGVPWSSRSSAWCCRSSGSVPSPTLSERRAAGWAGPLRKPGKEDKEGVPAAVDEKRVDRLAKVLERETVKRNVVQVRSIEQFLGRFRKLVDQFGGRPVTIHRRPGSLPPGGGA